MIRPLFNYYGSKSNLASWIVQHFPPHVAYVETHAGSAVVCLNKPRSGIEVLNDKWDEVVNVFRVLRDEQKAQRLIEACYLTPYAKSEYELAVSEEIVGDDVERARRFVTRSFLSFGSRGVFDTVGFRREKVSSNSAIKPWLKYPNELFTVIERLRGVVIENEDATGIIKRYDSVDTLFYVDPPYVDETRKSLNVYEFEMTVQDHKELSSTLHDVKGMVVLSGYRCDMYDDLYRDWERTDKQGVDVVVSKRTESLWVNQSVASKIQGKLF